VRCERQFSHFSFFKVASVDLWVPQVTCFAHDSFSVQVNSNLDGEGTKRAIKSN
jgi:hypothetical protein